MKKIFLIFVVLLSIGVVVKLAFFGASDVLTQDDQQYADFPSQPNQPYTEAAGISGMERVSLFVNGEPISVKNFFESEGVVADPQNYGSYILHGFSEYCEGEQCGVSEEMQDFSIVYSSLDDSFSIILYKEPFSETRQKAEQKLRDKLGIGSEQMCKLNYMVSVPYWVNESYAGVNLKFSFCPGSVNFQ